jgi:hypothetical protein
MFDGGRSILASNPRGLLTLFGFPPRHFLFLDIGPHPNCPSSLTFDNSTSDERNSLRTTQIRILVLRSRSDVVKSKKCGPLGTMKAGNLPTPKVHRAARYLSRGLDFNI